MFTYCFIDRYGIETPAEFAYNRDLEYLESLVDGKKYMALKILSRIF